jgi:hypothetical protein
MMRSQAIVFVLSVIFLVAFDICHAFQVTPHSTTVRSVSRRADVPLLHMAKKKRRRKLKDAPVTPTSSSIPDNSDDLPDFDLGDESDGMDSAAPKKPRKTDEITDVMMGTQKPLGSIKDLISDRSLEKSFQFDEPDDPLPDLGELKTPQPVGKKKARQEARRLAAIAEEEQEGSIVDSVSDALSSLPFLKSDRESSELKLVENATWLGIFLLVAWELYINSPFFERAAPIAPIVYNFFI